MKFVDVKRLRHRQAGRRGHRHRHPEARPLIITTGRRHRRGRRRRRPARLHRQVHRHEPDLEPGLLQARPRRRQALFLQTAPWKTFSTDIARHKAMRDALGSSITPNDGYTAGGLVHRCWPRSRRRGQQGSDPAGCSRPEVAHQVAYEGMLPDAPATTRRPDARFRRRGLHPRPATAHQCPARQGLLVGRPQGLQARQPSTRSSDRRAGRASARPPSRY